MACSGLVAWTGHQVLIYGKLLRSRIEEFFLKNRLTVDRMQEASTAGLLSTVFGSGETNAQVLARLEDVVWRDLSTEKDDGDN